MSLTSVKKKLSRFTAYLGLTMGVFIALTASFAFYVYSEKQIDQANEARLKSFLLAQELSQSSDDLTRMARTYVITGDAAYKRHFQEILDIREGRKPRPANAYVYATYWDLAPPDGQQPSMEEGQAAPLLELMRQAGFSEDEFAKLAEAKTHSDALTDTEYAAMRLIESLDAPSEASRTQAIQMLHDAAYHRAKANIMRLIGEFQQMMDQRTLDAVHLREDMALLFRTLLALFGLLLAFMLRRAYQTLQAVLGGSVNELYEKIALLGSGDFSLPTQAASGMDDSVLGWIAETQRKLVCIDVERKAAEAKNWRMAQLYNALSECNQAIIRCPDETSLFRQICRDVVTVGGMKMAWIGVLEPATQGIEPIESWGEGTEYLQGISISIDQNLVSCWARPNRHLRARGSPFLVPGFPRRSGHRALARARREVWLAGFGRIALA
jgi:hypothetical protein